MKSFLQGIKDVEEAREDTKQPSFMTLLFVGEPDFRLLMPFPRQSAEEKAIGDAICAKVAAILVEHVDPAQIERTGVIPRDALDAIAEIGCFGLNIPQRYGGIVLSQTNYNRILELVGSYCNNLAVHGHPQRRRTSVPRRRLHSLVPPTTIPGPLHQAPRQRDNKSGIACPDHGALHREPG